MASRTLWSPWRLRTGLPGLPARGVSHPRLKAAEHQKALVSVRPVRYSSASVSTRPTHLDWPWPADKVASDEEFISSLNDRIRGAGPVEVSSVEYSQADTDPRASFEEVKDEELGESLQRRIDEMATSPSSRDLPPAPLSGKGLCLLQHLLLTNSSRSQIFKACRQRTSGLSTGEIWEDVRLVHSSAGYTWEDYCCSQHYVVCTNPLQS